MCIYKLCEFDINDILKFKIIRSITRAYRVMKFILSLRIRVYIQEALLISSVHILQRLTKRVHCEYLQVHVYRFLI